MPQTIIEDRRIEPQISLTVLTHMEERLARMSKAISDKFDAHTEDEMARYDEILSLIAQSNTDHNERHKLLLESVDKHMEKTAHIYEGLVSAFPQNRKGEPDFHGHAQAHDAWIESAAATRELMSYIKKSIVVAMILAMGSWAGMLVWQGFLHGPKP